MSVLTVREFTRIPIAACFSSDVEAPSLAARNVTSIARLNRKFYRRARFEPLELGYQAVRTLQYVGVVSMGPECIEILPKVDAQSAADTNGYVRQNLLRMLAVTRRLPIREAEVTRLASQNHHLLEIVLRLYCEKLFAQIHRGLLNAYQSFEENLPVLRGRLLLNIHVKHNLPHRERFYCKYDSFTVDNPLNQLLKAATRVALALGRTGYTRALASQLLFALAEVSDKSVTLQHWHLLPRDRTTARYSELLQLAATILFAPYPDVVAGEVPQLALLFDMAELFEEFVGRKVRTLSPRLGCVVHLQGPQEWLAEEIQNSGAIRSRFRLRPDIVLTMGEKVRLIADTKWKLLAPGNPSQDVQQSDIYQMLAYAKRYSCSRIVLIYPCPLPVDAKRLLVEYRIDETTVSVAGIDLRDLSTVDDQLTQVILPLMDHQ